jgi:general secretion pathway protein I
MFTLKIASKGFTLLEVMISVSIIAIIFVSLFRMQFGTIGLATAGKFNSIAPMLTNQLLTQIESDISGWSEVKGDFGEDFPGVEWTCEIFDSAFGQLDFISEENQGKFKKIKIEITGASGSRSYKVNTWRVSDE